MISRFRPLHFACLLGPTAAARAATAAALVAETALFIRVAQEAASDDRLEN